ncbi:PLP-dependent aminotransferase family protein [Xanthomonas prunicola]|uniref:PLP-dependent aminotransferase family protein n=1 Tax=Xanthomonas prunicola TaxID=2053930 RepID=A0A2N3RGL8_9XANT|nr:PLP-dependent aminotransferase family protein [Xanthomonas prunicola]PKV11648.1 PLP-dependent aminotransferase family protein [Xanthomonas prunicola]PKV16146.1 PLP-dependent aminotransferase family protein [Xanthomonas prunicola]PKV20408.1 PLP-dependent aminotransferase family protein [Xanthomonas prunicola]
MASTQTDQAMGDDRLDVMTFLNEVSSRHPNAISFVSGRPTDSCFDLQAWMRAVPRLATHLAQRHRISQAGALDLIAQYGTTQGIIEDLVVAQLAADEGVPASIDRMLITAGCQEALHLCVTELCRQPNEVVLVRNPTYIGITGVADSHGITIAAFNRDGRADAEALAETLDALHAAGQRARLLYLVPDFDNPTGTVLPRDQREAITAVCAAHGVLILEDNPYGLFAFETERVPTMRALDSHGCVIYLGTYSKTLCPGLRVGFLVLPPTLFGSAAAARTLHQALTRRKSFGTLNTSQVTQAVVGGVLLEHGCSLAPLIQAPRALYQRNRDRMLECLAHELGALTPQIHWNVPAGGFFLIVTLPFVFAAEEAASCARECGVLVMPLSFFAIDGSCRQQVRLAYSNVATERIAEGIARFSRFVRHRLHAADSLRQLDACPSL